MIAASGYRPRAFSHAGIPEILLFELDDSGLTEDVKELKERVDNRKS
jgi:hypothetical protein